MKAEEEEKTHTHAHLKVSVLSTLLPLLPAMAKWHHIRGLMITPQTGCETKQPE